ncbi:hypothetical protein BDQ17DRAFT_88445 [Cyathus striatus]|nr:hypothetical protein BDQ17DRAFT_88445 [Cyathus striatus]
MHLLFIPNHIQLLNACYPPVSSVVANGAECLPNSHELSRLTYYASNHPGKLTKLGGELEKRLKAECRKARNGNVRSRASLLISLSIFWALATECKRDILLLSPSLMASVYASLSSLPYDLEVVARTATVFTAWTTYTDGHLIGADSAMTKDYLSALGQFSHLSSNNSEDQETKNRTRLVGFAALMGALNSDALYNDSVQFQAQALTILRPILLVLFEADFLTLDEQAIAVKDAPKSHYLAEFRTRPVLERRAASIHIHVDGDNGPSKADVIDAALRAVFSLLSHTNGVQLSHIMRSCFENLEGFGGWEKVDHCCWLVQKIVDWTPYQYRYVIPTQLVEHLKLTGSASSHFALISMLTTIFNASTPLVNLSSSDILGNLVSLLFRRITLNLQDSLLPKVVDCISSLGRHVYYADQIQDLAAEIVSHIVVVEVQGVLGENGRPDFNETRSATIRYLLRGLSGVIRTANKHESVRDPESCPLSPARQGRSRSSSREIKKDVSCDRAARRTKVSVDIWQDTLSLLCDRDFSVRAEYSDVLLFYIGIEMPKQGDGVDADGVKRVRKLVEGPFLQATYLNALLNMGDISNKFLNWIHAYTYILATNHPLGVIPNGSPSSSPPKAMEPILGSPTTRIDIPHNTTLDSSATTHSGEHRPISLTHAPRGRKTSLVRNLLESTSPGVSDKGSTSLSDYRNILKVLITVQEQVPVRGLLSGVPMLLELERAARRQAEMSSNLIRTTIIREIIVHVLLVIGRVWNLSKLVQLAEQALSSGQNYISHPDVTDYFLTSNLSPLKSIPLDEDSVPQSIPWCGIEPEDAISVIACSEVVQEALGMDRKTLLIRLSAQWSAEIALRDGLDKIANFETSIRGDGVSPLLKISPALMHIENVSLQSLTRSARGLGVIDLREALEGRSSMSNPALAKPPSISTLDHAPSTAGGDVTLQLTKTRSRTRTKRRLGNPGSNEVRDVLSRLGIGKQQGSLSKGSS